MKREKMIALILSALVFFSGCGYSGGVDSLLSPPRLNSEQNEVWLAMTKALQTEEIRLVYPQKGEYRSAFVMANIDEDASNEALVFYRPVSAAGNTSEIHIHVLDRVEGEWVSIGDSVLEGTQIEDVTLMNVGTGVPFIAIGLNYVSDGGNVLKILSLSGGELTTVSSFNYQSKAVLDFTLNGLTDIVLIEPKVSEVNTQATLISYQNGRFLVKSSVAVDPRITRYSTVTVGYLPSGEQALYFDAYTGTDTMTTEILSVEMDWRGRPTLLNLTYDGTSLASGLADRFAGSLCYDWGSDGVIEVPGSRLLPGYDDDTNPSFYLTDWYVFSEGEYSRIKTSFMNYALGYAFDFPESWIGSVSVRYNAYRNEITFYEYDETAEGSQGEDLLSLRVAARKDYDETLKNDYQLIEAKGQIVYLARLGDAVSDKNISLAQVKRSFTRLQS